MKKIVYVMHVDWNWIKQRPQYIAEEMSEIHDLTVIYQHRYKRKGHQKRDAGNVCLKPIYVIPRGDRYPVLRDINRAIRNISIKKQVRKKKAECLYLPFPGYVGAIPKKYAGKVIYDCMDNYPAFLTDRAARAELEQQEAALLQRADTVLVSSNKLKEVLLKRHGTQYEGKITLVRNGYNGQPLETPAHSTPTRGRYKLAYFGTISTWFNFDFILKSVRDIPDIEYLLMGPLDGVQIPQHERIRYIGTVEHKELFAATEDAQCLIMPFVRNEIIESVDPVKLYEYINFNKNILCVKYPEVERFDPFVYFYSDYESYKKQLEHLLKCDTVKYTETERITFLSENSWKSRMQVIDSLL